MNTLGYVELIKKTFNASYYKITRMLGTTDTTMDNWRKGKVEASPENAVKIADALNMDRALVVAELDVERAENEEVKAVRREILNRLKKATAVVVIVFFTSTGAVIDHVQCVLCQIALQAAEWLKKAILLPILALGYLTKGLNNEQQKAAASRLGRLPHGRGLYISTGRTRRTPQPDRKLLVSDLAASMHRGRTRALQSARAAVSIGLITVSGACCASWGVSVGTISDHSGSAQHNERNPGVCLETGFKRFGVACGYRDSNKETATAFAVGGRFKLIEWFHLGGAFGVKIAKALNEEYELVTDPDPMAAAVITFGNEAIAANVIVTPEIEDTPGARWLQFRVGF